MRDLINLFETPQIKWSERTFPGDHLVWIDTEKVRSSWSLDKDFYFDADDHPNAIRKRIPRFDEWLKKGEAVEAPQVALNDQGEIIFTNGRHRFVWMVQHGVDHIPVMVPDEYVDEITRRFS
jgi:hypothetical protein